MVHGHLLSFSLKSNSFLGPTSMKRTVWDHYNTMARTADNSREVEWGALTDTILLFVSRFFLPAVNIYFTVHQAGLFAAFLSTFLAITTPRLEPDNLELTLRAIVQLSHQLSNLSSSNSFNTPYDPPEFFAPSNVGHVNVLFYTSLSLILFAAFLSMVIKTWLQNFDRGMRAITSPEMRAKERECRYQSLMRWRVHWVVALLPFLVQLSLGVFAAGLFLFLKPLHTPSAYIILSISSLALLFYLVVTLIPFTDEFSPFSLPFTRRCLQFLYWEKAAFAIAGQKWRNESDITTEENHLHHGEIPSDYPGLSYPPSTIELSSSHSPWHTTRFLWNRMSRASRFSSSVLAAIWAAHLPPLRKKVKELARERHRQKQSTYYTRAHPQIIRALLRNTVVAPDHLPVYISVFQRSQDRHIRPQDWRLIIDILDELQVDVDALSQTEARGVLFVLGSVYEGRFLKRELSVAKSLCSRFGEANGSPINAVLRHLMLGRIFDREEPIHLWHWDQACVKIRTLEASEENINILIWVSGFIAKYLTLPYVQIQYDRDRLMRQCLQLLRSMLIFAGTVPISTPSKPKLISAIYSAIIVVGNAFLDGVWPQSYELSVDFDTRFILNPVAKLLNTARFRAEDPSGSFLCTLFIPCLLLNGEHPSRWGESMRVIDIINSLGVTDQFGLTAWTGGLEGLWKIYQADPSRLLGCMAYLARDCFPEHTMVDHFDIFLKGYDTSTSQDRTRMDLPTLRFLQFALERIIEKSPQEIDCTLKTLRDGLSNPWLLLHIETTCGIATSLTTQELDWFNSPAFDNIANRRITLYNQGAVPPEWDLLSLFYQSSSFTTHFGLLCLYTKLWSPQDRSEDPNGALYLNLLERVDVVVAATFKTNQAGTVNLIDYLILVEQLQPRWKALPKPWRSTFATLFTRRSEALAWVIEIARCLKVEFRERGLEGNIPRRIPPIQLNDPFIPDDARSLSVYFQNPNFQDSASPKEGAAAVSHAQQIGPRYLNAAASLLSFISEMLREVNSSPPDELCSLYASLLSLPDLFGDRVCRNQIMAYMEGVFERVQMASEQFGTVPVASRQDSERIRRLGKGAKKRGKIPVIQESQHPGTA